MKLSHASPVLLHAMPTCTLFSLPYKFLNTSYNIKIKIEICISILYAPKIEIKIMIYLFHASLQCLYYIFFFVS